MELERRTQRARIPGGATTHHAAAPGKHTLCEDLAAQPRAPQAHRGAEPPIHAPAASTPAPLAVAPSGPRPTLQMLFGGPAAAAATAAATEGPTEVHAAAARGTATPAVKLPYVDRIQRAFGRHDVSGIQAHVGGDAAAAATAMGAQAYATGEHVVLGPGADLFTVAHEAAHVVQQRAGVSVPGGVGATGDRHEQHADRVAEAVVRGESAEPLLDEVGGDARGTAPPGTVQHRRVLADIAAVHANNLVELKAGEDAVGFTDGVLATPYNAEKLAPVFTPNTSGDVSVMTQRLRRAVGNDYMEQWYEQVSKRIRTGAMQLMQSVQHWCNVLKAQVPGPGFVRPHRIQLTGSDLHDRGLGVAEVHFDRVVNGRMEIVHKMVKPEDRSIERDLLGTGNSLASQLNQQLPRTRRVQTIGMETDAVHGTLMDYVESTFTGKLLRILSAIPVQTDVEGPLIETIAFAFLAGITDIHKDNVKDRNGSPTLIDADIAAQPNEHVRPGLQEGFGESATQQIWDQLDSDEGPSMLITYAKNHLDVVTGLITAAVGNHTARIVPIYTAIWESQLSYYLAAWRGGTRHAAQELVRDLARDLARGRKPAPGLHRQLGPDRNGSWNQYTVEHFIRGDFEHGQLPVFSYHPATGVVTYHGQPIWRGDNIGDSMHYLKRALQSWP